jgi:hypothetical protein
MTTNQAIRYVIYTVICVGVLAWSYGLFNAHFTLIVSK